MNKSYGNLVPFKPGQSGNPGGRSALEVQVRRLAQERSVEALNRLTEIALHSDDERAVIVACDKLLDRAFGKAKEAPPETPLRRELDFSTLSDKDLRDLRRIMGRIKAAEQIAEGADK